MPRSEGGATETAAAFEGLEDPAAGPVADGTELSKAWSVTEEKVVAFEVPEEQMVHRRTHREE